MEVALKFVKRLSPLEVLYQSSNGIPYCQHLFRSYTSALLLACGTYCDTFKHSSAFPCEVKRSGHKLNGTFEVLSK